MNPSVTIGIPIYKRLTHLPNALRVVALQNYANIELLVSDNGMNGNTVPSIVEKHYQKQYRFRQNPSTVSGSKHFNQLIQEAHGQYVTILADDDEISPNFVSGLVQVLEKHPEASAALAREEVIDLAGNVLRASRDTVPEVLPGEEFIRTTWSTREYGYQSLCTFLAKKEKLLAFGGFPDIWSGTSDEDLLMVKLVLDGFVAFNTECAFRKRFYESSAGLAQDLEDLARGIREFIASMDSDPAILAYAASHPVKWKELREYLVDSAWGTYKIRWAGMYKTRLPAARWVAAGFALPFRKYGRYLVSTLKDAVLAANLQQVERISPKTYTAYRTAKARLRKIMSPGSEARN
jgi:glycosyltransferase involved in cell wall biosynthesis